MFTLKKIIGALLMPLPFSLLLLIAGTLLLWLMTTSIKGQRIAKLMITAGTVILLLGSLPVTTQPLIQSIERETTGTEMLPDDLRYIIVLGAGHVSDPYLPLEERLSQPAFYRLMKGISLMRTYPQATLILTGFGGSDPISNAEIYAKVAVKAGIDEKQLVLFPNARDTREEAEQVAAMIGDTPAALVTSASHMPRSLSLFAQYGAHPLPAPTYYLGKQPPQPQPFQDQLPQAKALHQITIIWHELIGRIWLFLTK